MLPKPEILLFLLLLFCFSESEAQKEGNIWYFGARAGIDFNGKTPVALTDGVLSTNEGCASIADAEGKLLFYTDGINVWNKKHEKMANGTGLNGDPSSTQSGVIVPKPLNPDIYYVFTVDKEAGADGLQYSIVDITKNGGLGEITSKNNALVAPTTEKLTAVQHFNKRDIWVIGHEWNSNKYFAYLVTDKGVDSNNPVYSEIGSIHGGAISNSIGYLKVSSGGTKIASVVKNPNGFAELFDFDNKTGKLSNLIKIPNIENPYGVEFSTDNSKLYISSYSTNSLYQFDLSSSDPNIIITSKTLIYKSDYTLSALQLAPDRKIYVSRNGSSKMGLITKPNESGKLCNYIEEGFDLDRRTCIAGLPTFIQSFFIPVTDFTYGPACAGEFVSFNGLTNIDADVYNWNFGDLANPDNSSDSKNPKHRYEKSGNYKVRFVIGKGTIYDTVIKYIRVEAIPNPNLGKDQLRCNGETVELDAGTGEKYRWNTGDSTRTIKVTKSGKYWVQVNNQTCANADSVNVQFLSKEDLQLGDDTVLCQGSKCIVRSKINGAKYLWNTGSRDSAISVLTSGNYWLNTTVGDCSITDTIKVTFIPPPSINMGNDSMLCEGEELVLDAKNPGAEYEWSTGEKTQKITVKIGGNYWVKVYAGDCSASDTIHFYPCPARIVMPNAFTPNGDGLNDYYRVFAADVFKGTLTITNRWGEIIFQTDDIYKGWDGKYHGKKSPDGQYFWTLLYWDYDGKVLYPREKKGPFYLLGQ